MFQNKYLYIVCRDGQIVEVEYSEDRLLNAMNAMKNKGLFSIKGVGFVLNGADISKVLDGVAYDSWVETARPKTFLKDGTWYDIVERKAIRNEQWKQDIVDNQKKLENQKEYLTPEKREQALKRTKEIGIWLKEITGKYTKDMPKRDMSMHNRYDKETDQFVR